MAESDIKTDHSGSGLCTWSLELDCNFRGHRGTWRYVVWTKLLCCLIAMFLSFSLTAYWPSSYPDTGTALEPVVEQNTIETFAVTYSYDILTGSGNQAWTVESTTMTNFMAACTTRKISHPGSAGPSTVIGTWYRGTKDLTWAGNMYVKSDPCSSGETYNASSTASCGDWPVDPCIIAGSTTVKYAIGSAFIYLALWIKISFVDKPETMLGDTLRIWNLVYLVCSLIAFALTASADSTYKSSCGDLIEEMLTKQMTQLKAQRGEVVRVSGAALNLVVASTVFGVFTFVIGLVEWWLYYRHGKRLGVGDREWKGSEERVRIGGGAPASDADTDKHNSLPVNSHVIQHGETPLGHEL